jgi:putative sigma-54 modulation protein
MGEDSANALNVMLDAEEEEEDLNPTSAADIGEDFVEMSIGSPEITKIKSFDLSTPISVKEAIFALDYIDHDFYVFRDAATSEISVVYKRNAGGVGLIQPSDQ